MVVGFFCNAGSSVVSRHRDALLGGMVPHEQNKARAPPWLLAALGTNAACVAKTPAASDAAPPKEARPQPLRRDHGRLWRPRSPAPHQASWPSVPRRPNRRGRGCRCRTEGHPLAGTGHPQPRARPWPVVRFGDPALWRALRTAVRQARVRAPACKRMSAQTFGDSTCGSAGFQFALRVTADHVADRLGPCLAGEVGEFYPPLPAILRT